MMSFDTTTVEVVLFLGLTLVAWSWLNNPIKSYNSPNWIPVLGNFIPMAKNLPNFNIWVWEVSEKFMGKPWALHAPFQKVRIISNDPETVQYILKDNFENFDKGDTFHQSLKPLLGDGIFNVDGETWRVQRKKTSRIFTGKNFREFISKVSFEEAGGLNCYLKEAAKAKKTIDIHDVFHRMTMDTFCRIAFGYNANSLSSTSTPPFALAFNRVQHVLAQRLLVPGWKVLELLNGVRTKLNSDLKVTDELIYKIINQRKNDPHKEDHHDLLSLYLGVAEDADGQKSDEYLRDMVMNIILAG
ncbi:hypothetical protein K7432_015791, partial [Basidiobolus ranarum]